MVSAKTSSKKATELPTVRTRGHAPSLRQGRPMCLNSARSLWWWEDRMFTMVLRTENQKARGDT